MLRREAARGLFVIFQFMLDEMSQQFMFKRDNYSAFYAAFFFYIKAERCLIVYNILGYLGEFFLEAVASSICFS